MSAPLSPAPVKRRLPDALPPYLSNGVLGIRFASLPHLPGTTMVSGFAGLDARRRRRRLRPRALRPGDRRRGRRRLGFGGSRMGRGHRAALRLRDRRAARRAGPSGRRRDRDGRDGRLLRADRCPRWPPCEVTVTVDGPADLALAAGIDPTGVPGFADEVRPAAGPGTERGRRRPAAVALVGRHLDAGHGLHDGVRAGTRRRSDRRPTRDERGWFSTTYRAPRPDGSALSAQPDHGGGARSCRTPDRTSRRGGSPPSGAKRGFDGLRRANRAAWESCGADGSRSMAPTRAGRRSPTPASSTC